jgi:hypothetical protein
MKPQSRAFVKAGAHRGAGTHCPGECQWLLSGEEKPNILAGLRNPFIDHSFLVLLVIYENINTVRNLAQDSTS